MDTDTTRDERHNASYTPATKDAASATDWRSDPWPITAEPAGTQSASYYDPLNNENQGMYGGTYSTADSYQAPRRRTRPAWVGVLLLVVAVLRLLSHFVGSSHSSTSDTTYTDTSSLLSSYIVPGVNVCGPANVSIYPVGCTAGDTTVAAKSGAQLCYATIDSSLFTGTSIAFTVEQLNAGGKVTAQGTSTDAVGVSDSSSCTTLDDVIHNAKLPLRPGSYTVYVAVGGTDLGYATFTLTGKAL